MAVSSICFFFGSSTVSILILTAVSVIIMYRDSAVNFAYMVAVFERAKASASNFYSSAINSCKAYH